MESLNSELGNKYMIKYFYLKLRNNDVVIGIWYTFWAVNVFPEEAGRWQSQTFPYLFMVDAFQDILFFGHLLLIKHFKTMVFISNKTLII